MKPRKGPLIAFIVFVMLFGAFLLVLPRAYADEVPSSSASSSSASVDYTEVLESIDSKLDNLATHDDVVAVADGMTGLASGDDVSALSKVVKSLQPVDNSERIEALSELFSALTGVSVFQWVTLLLLLGVLCALVFLVAYRSHT